MKYIDEFRDKRLIAKAADGVRRAAAGRDFTFMEVCGTHTMAIFRYGLRELLPTNIRLISGPGCPVCVTPNDYLDKAIAIASMDGVVVATFGDMMRVPGSRSSLYAEKAAGADIRAVYSTDDAIAIARKNPGKQVVFLGVGFETTAPTVAASILEAKREGVKNYSVLCAHKTMPEVMAALLEGGDVRVDGFLLPGHVSAIIGTKPYEFIARKYGRRCVAAGFEPLDVMQAISMLIEQRVPKIEIQYKRIMSGLGNSLARKIIKKVFDKTDTAWRGLGIVKASGLKIKKSFSDFDADIRFHPKVPRPVEPKGCLCGQVLKGEKIPTDCRLFGRSCTPDNPVGACMVSSEGTCATYYKYETAV
jgi:hydrogenase expression/formation protein HypD